MGRLLSPVEPPVLSGTGRFWLIPGKMTDRGREAGADPVGAPAANGLGDAFNDAKPMKNTRKTTNT